MALILIIQNLRALAPISDYHYEVLVGDGTPDHSQSIAAGTITGHVRNDGWQQLVACLLQQNPT